MERVRSRQRAGEEKMQLAKGYSIVKTLCLIMVMGCGIETAIKGWGKLFKAT